MKILEFTEKFPTEQSCKDAFIAMRLREGIKCARCGSDQHKWKKKREQWECKECAHRTTVKSGTVMQNSKLSFQYWFLAMHLLTCTKKSFSAKEVQRQLGHKRYEPIWAMLHKLRSVMGLRDGQYTLGGEIELDEGFFETVDKERDKEKPLKRGRGSQRQTQVLVMTESKPVENEMLSSAYQQKRRLGFVKMKVLNSYAEKEMEDKTTGSVEVGTTINTDGSTSYSKLKNTFDHRPKTSTKQEASTMLPWVHKAISNAKRLLLDVHHRIDNDFLENYLNEFVFKLNRRYFLNLFDRLLIAAVSNRWNYLGETCG